MADFVDLLATELTGIFGDKVWDDDATMTAQRWLRAMREFTPESEMPFKFTTFPAVANQMIIVKDIKFSSLCAHHLFPFSGTAYVGYLPNELQVGLSKIPRLVHWMANKPSSQEMITREIASFMKHQLSAMGVAVVISSTHTCMSCRGVREHDAAMVTSEMRGVFLTASEARNEFMTLAGLK